jgi:hypothetical protein
MWTLWHKKVVVNFWKVKINAQMDQSYPFYGPSSNGIKIHKFFNVINYKESRHEQSTFYICLFDVNFLIKTTFTTLGKCFLKYSWNVLKNKK